MDAKNESNAFGEKHVNDIPAYGDLEESGVVATSQNILHRELKGRHMQMIAM